MGHRDAAVREVASGVTVERVGTATSAGEVRGVSSSGGWPVVGGTSGLPRSGTSSTVGSHRTEVGSREFGSLKQPVPKFSGKLGDFPLWEDHFEVFTCWVYVLVPRSAHYFGRRRFERLSTFSLAGVDIMTTRVSWTCLTESIANRDLLGKVFATKSPSAGWRLLCA